MPRLSSLADEYRGQGVEVVGIAGSEIGPSTEEKLASRWLKSTMATVLRDFLSKLLK